MQLTKPVIAFEDERGIIKDIVFKEALDAVTIIESKKGVVRGNHYHEETIQWVYLHSGRIRSFTQIPGQSVEVHVLEPGHLLRTDAHERHALEAIEDSLFFVLTRGPRGGLDYEKDTFRLEIPLKAP